MDLIIEILKDVAGLAPAAIIALILAYFLQKPVKNGFDVVAAKLAETFTETVSNQIIPMIKDAMERTREDVLGIMKRWEPTPEVKEHGQVIIAEIKRHIDAGDYAAALKAVEEAETPEQKATNYKELAKMCMARKERFTCFRAANRHVDLAGRTAESYRFLGYVYWWFNDLDTAIIHTENALQLALEQKPGTESEEVISAIKNNLAFYCAEKGVNKDQALSYIEDSLQTSPGHPFRLDTKGYILLKFGTDKADLDEAIECFQKALEQEPEDEDILRHLQETLVKKKLLQKK